MKERSEMFLLVYGEISCLKKNRLLSQTTFGGGVTQIE